MSYREQLYQNLLKVNDYLHDIVIVNEGSLCLLKGLVKVDSIFSTARYFLIKVHKVSQLTSLATCHMNMQALCTILSVLKLHTNCTKILTI